MKHFLLGMLLVFLIILLAEQSKAQPVAYAVNEDGGMVVFSDQLCPEQIGLLVTVTTKAGEEVHGCWIPRKDGIVVKWTGVQGEPVVLYKAPAIQIIKGVGV